MKIRPRFFAYLLFVSLVCAGTSRPQSKPSSASPGTAQRVLVKIRTTLARAIETDLQQPELVIMHGGSRNNLVQGFMARHSVRKLTPLYPNLVRMKIQQGLSDAQMAARVRHRFANRAARSRVAATPEISRTYVLELTGVLTSDLNKAVDKLSADPDVEFAEPDRVVSVKQTPNDPYLSSTGSWGQSYPDLWGILKIGAPSAWNINAGDGIIVAVVDTGIDYNHPDIAANVWVNTNEVAGNGIDDDGNGFIDDVRGWDFIGSTYTNPTESNNPIDHFGHGTHVAGTIAAVGNNGIGVIGVAWRAQVMAVKGLDDTGTGLESTLSNAIIYAANNGADVINNSWGGPGSSQTIADAVNYAYGLGAVVVAAAGNNNDDARNYFPANLEQVITVAATDSTDFKAYFSNWGSKIDVAAPGVDILSLRAAGTTMGTPVDSNYTRADGTSMATPHVSGLAALILSQQPTYSNEDVRQVLRVSATDLGSAGFDLDYGYGRINASAALGVAKVLEARIKTPADGAHVNGSTTISGVAQGNNFAQYTLEYGSGYLPSSWTQITSSEVPVANGTLGVFDPSTLADGVYTLRLTAFDVTGARFVDRIALVTDYVSLSSPVPPRVPVTASVFKPGTQITITGTATGASFQDYRIEWAEGINPSSGWTSAGMSLTNGGLSPVTGGTLGTWDTSAITTADYYTIRVSVDDSGFVSQATTLVYLEPDLLTSNWPKWLDQAPYLASGAVPATDPSGNPHLALVSPVYLNSPLGGEYRNFTGDGASLSTTPLFYGNVFQPAAGDLDGNPGDEVAVGEANSLRVFFADNTSNVLSPAFWANFQYSQIILEDLDGDSQLETMALGTTQAKTAYVFAWTRSGSQLNANFPIQVADQNLDIHYATGPRFLVGDINGDGKKEILVQEGDTPSTFQLRLFANDGTPLPWSAPQFNGYVDQMALADLDHNGKLETLIISIFGSQKVLHVLQPDGTERPGWPVPLASTSMSFLAVGDLDRDGREEIVVSNFTRLYVFEPDGTSFSSAWPRLENPSGFNALGPVVLADINGDGYPEILVVRDELLVAPNPFLPASAAEAPNAEALPGFAVTTENSVNPDGTLASQIRTDVSAQAFPSNAYEEPKLIVLDRNNTILRSWRLLGANGNQPFYDVKLTVGDFNNDGMTDIAATYFTISGGGISGFLDEGVLTVLTTGAPLNTPANDWPMIFQNPRNTALLRRDSSAPSVTISSPAAGATLQATVSLTASVNDSQRVTGVQFQMDDAPMGSQVTTAPYTMAWDTSVIMPGSHTLRAIVHDAANHVIVSPPVAVTVSQSIVATISPAALDFGRQPLNTTSAAQVVTVSNVGVLPISNFTVQVTGDFSQTNNCGALLAVNTSCVVNVVYTPTLAGPESASLIIGGNFVIAPPPVTLSGFGNGAFATLSPVSLSFPAQPINSTSAPHTLTYTNTGNFPVGISSISVTGDFAQTNNCPSSLAVGTSCNINVTFTPTASGARNGTVTILGDFNASAPLNGTGQTGFFAPLSLNFGQQTAGTTSPPQLVTIANTSTTSFFINGWSWNGGFNVVSNCPFTIAVGTSCTFSVTFAPSGGGNYSGNLTINGNFPGAPAVISTSGTGMITSGILLPNPLDFGNQTINVGSVTKALTLFNTGNQVLNITGIAVSGDFSQTNNCGASLDIGANCFIYVVFTPTAHGPRTGTANVQGNFTLSAPSASLTGNGVAPSTAFSPPSLTFANQLVGTASPAQPVTLANTGDGALTIFQISASGDFSQTNNCGGSLAAGSSCTVNVTFTPTTTGSRSGSLTVTTIGTTVSPVTLAGTGVAPAASLSPSSLNFASQLLNSTSSAQTITLSNTGTAPLQLSSISITGTSSSGANGFAQTNNCGSSLAPGANCAINVTFTPSVFGSLGASLTVTSNARAATAGLTGTGVAAIASVSPQSLTFGNQLVQTASVAQSVSLTNTGNIVLSISSITTTGDFAQTNNCGASLAAGTSCTINVTFTPTARLNRVGSLAIQCNSTPPAPGIALSGIGIAPVPAFSPATLSFGNQRVGTSSAAQVLTLANNGDAALSANGLLITGSSEFTQTNNCPGSLTPGQNCSVSVVFTPASRGAKAATISVNTQPAFSTLAALSGTGIAPAATLTSSVNFGFQDLRTSATQNATLSNVGELPLTISSISISGGAYSQSHTCGNSLAVGSSCTIQVKFNANTLGTVTGSLTVTDNDPAGGTQVTTLTGTGVDFALSASPTSVTVAAGQTASYTISIAPLGGNFPNGVSLTCGGLPSGTTCTFSASPVVPGSSSASTVLNVTTGNGQNGTQKTPTGSHGISISGVSGSLKHNVSVTLVVN